MISVGIDIGSSAAKAVVYNDKVLGSAIVPTGWNPKEAGMLLFEQVLTDTGISRDEVGIIVGTGYGRVSLPLIERKITEITCHARGARHLFPRTRTVIDIGGQDSKVISVDDTGIVADFVMNDKCAAGTGRFLQVMTGVLDITLGELGEMALQVEPLPINSMCTVFAESEIIGLLARGEAKAAIASGIIDAIARRLLGLTARVPCIDEITFSGGVANNSAICTVLSEKLGVSFNVPKEPQIIGAIGAAVIGFEQLSKT